MIFYLKIKILSQNNSIDHTNLNNSVTEVTDSVSRIHYCPSCGYQLAIDTRYCPNCGKEL